MTPSPPPLVDVIAEVLRVHVKRNIKGCDCGWAELGKDHRDHQARAVLDALEQAGGVEWGVRWPLDVLGARPLETVSRSAAEATAESLAKITPKGNPAPVVVSRIVGPWTAVEG